MSGGCVDMNIKDTTRRHSEKNNSTGAHNKGRNWGKLKGLGLDGSCACNLLQLSFLGTSEYWDQFTVV